MAVQNEQRIYWIINNCDRMRGCLKEEQIYVRLRVTTVHGFNRISQFANSTITTVVFALWTCFCVGFCLWESANTFNSYRKFGVETTSKPVEWGSEGFPFPAITICPASIGLKSVLGMIPLVRDAVMISGTRITDMNQIEKLVKMCDAHISPAAAVKFMISFQNGSLGYGAEEYANTQVDSYHAVVHCKWNNQELDCGRLFINKPTDSGFCFTFNPAVDLLKAYKLEHPGDEYNDPYGKTYGSSASEAKLFVSTSTGLNSGFSVILLSNTSELCSSFLGYGGYVATIHDPSIEPLTWRQNGINLSPGWQTNVAMSITKTDRSKTESFGYCKSRLNLFTFKNVVDYKSRDLYAVDCLVKKVINRCKCAPYYTPRGTMFYFSDFPDIQFPYGNENLTGVLVCGEDLLHPIPQTDCQNQLEKNELRSDRSCYLDAPKPCEEMQIFTKMTATRWPNAAYLPYLKRHIGNTAGMTLEEFQQNFLSVQFFYESPQYTLVTETIEMTWVDLMNQVGGAMGMTLGLSLVGIVQITIWLVMRPVAALAKLVEMLMTQNRFTRPYYTP